MSCVPPATRQAGGFLARLHPGPRVALFAALILASASLPVGAWRAQAGLACLLAALAVASRPRWGALAWRLAKVLPFALVACAGLWLNPRPGARALAAMATAKACFGLAALGLMGALTPFPELLEALRSLRAPALLVRLLGFTWRFGFLLAEEMASMRRGLLARGWNGRWIWQAATLGHLLGGLFLRSLERAERVHGAMLCRGFDPAVPLAPAPHPPVLRRDAALALATAGLALFLRIALA